MENDEEEFSFVGAVKTNATTHLLNDLDKFDGQKMFVWESECMRRVDLLVPYSEIATRNIKCNVILPDKPENLNGYLTDEIKHIFFIIPPIRKMMERVFSCLGAKLSGTYSYHVRILTRIPKQLQELFDSNEYVKRRTPTLQSWPFYWSPTFGDLLLNNFSSTSPSRLLLTDDYEQFFLCACALNDMFTAKNFYWQGQWAQQVMQNWKSLKQSSHEPIYVFDQIVVIDRLIDPVTPLLEQFSFSGVLDTIFGINNKGTIEVYDEMLKKQRPLSESQQGSVTKIQLESDAYKNLIHLSMNGAITEIRKTLRDLSETQNSHEKLTYIKEFKQYMPILSKIVESKKFAGQALDLASIGICWNAQPENNGQILCEQEILLGNFSSSEIVPFIEELIIDGGDEKKAIVALRLIALQSLVNNGGLQPKVWNEYQRLLVQSFGPQAVAWCLNLQITGLVCASRSDNQQFAQTSNELKRMKCVANDDDPIASFYNGYVPLIVRQLEQKVRENWKGFETWRNEKLKDNFIASSRSPKRALFVIGGLTRSEIACLHYKMMSTDRVLKPAFQCIFTTSILKQGDLVDFTSVM